MHEAGFQVATGMDLTEKGLGTSRRQQDFERVPRIGLERKNASKKAEALVGDYSVYRRRFPCWWYLRIVERKRKKCT